MFYRSICFLLVTLTQLCGVEAWATNDRRAFLQKAAATVAATSGATAPALAYERRDVGGEGRSATTAAMNEQAYQTNNRLEKEGFKLDTREEEQARLSDAMSSFSYDSVASTNGGNKSKNNKSKTQASAK